MKKSLLVLFFVFSLSVLVQAQNTTFKSNFCVNAGFSLVGTIISAAQGHTSSVPAIQVTYDYSVADWFSLGGAFSYQSMKVDYEDNSYGNYSTSLNRLNVAARGLFHYANTGNLDLYSGIRMGYTNWSVSTNSTDPNYSAGDIFKGGGIAIQVVAFGVRGYFNDHFGVNSELAIGAPHYLSIGVNYRF